MNSIRRICVYASRYAPIIHRPASVPGRPDSSVWWLFGRLDASTVKGVRETKATRGTDRPSAAIRAARMGSGPRESGPPPGILTPRRNPPFWFGVSMVRFPKQWID